jgi:hypothetical protein
VAAEGNPAMCEALLVAATALCCGQALFAHFEERTSPWRRLAKVFLLLGSTALVSWLASRNWAIVWVGVWLLLGVSVHIWWTHRHKINPWTAEPRERYYELRGWD